MLKFLLVHRSLAFRLRTPIACSSNNRDSNNSFVYALKFSRTFVQTVGEGQGERIPTERGTNSTGKTVFISEEDKKTYEEDGVVCLRGVFNDYWIQTVKRGIQTNLKYPGELGKFTPTEHDQDSHEPPTYYFIDYGNWKRIPEFEEFITKSPAAEITGKLMGSEHSAFYYDITFTKDPRTRRAIPWHQDQPYFALEGSQVCSIWMPVTHVSHESCIKYIKGSHKWGKWFWPKSLTNLKYFDKKSDGSAGSRAARTYNPTGDIDKDPDKYNFLSWDMKPGDCLVFHMLIVHGFPEATDLQGRQVFSTRWVGEDVTFATRPWPLTAPLVRGHLKPGDPIHTSPEYPVLWRRPVDQS